MKDLHLDADIYSSSEAEAFIHAFDTYKEETLLEDQVKQEFEDLEVNGVNRVDAQSSKSAPFDSLIEREFATIADVKRINKVK